MTVKELIELLQEYNGDMKVLIAVHCNGYDDCLFDSLDIEQHTCKKNDDQSQEYNPGDYVFCENDEKGADEYLVIW